MVVLDEVFEVRREPQEYPTAAREQRERCEHRDRVAPGEREAAIEQGITKPVDEIAKRVRRNPGSHALRHQRQRIEDWREIHQDHQHRHEDVLDVLYEYLKRVEREIE